MSILHIDPNKRLSPSSLVDFVTEGDSLKLSAVAVSKIQDCRDYLDNKLAGNDLTIYGINTGFGSLCNVRVNDDQLSQLQHNLVVSHACGVGQPIDDVLVKLMMVLKVHALSLGHSGTSVQLVQELVDMYNSGWLPVVYESGSLGASGDLAPLAHMSLPLLGLGEIKHNNEIKSGNEYLKALDKGSLELKSKEGLALLNGTQFMSAHGVYIADKIKHLVYWADLLAAMSTLAFDGIMDAFDLSIHRIRQQKGQETAARTIKGFLEGSPDMERAKEHVQDPYSFRCSPQVSGACRDIIDFARSIIENEINAVTDNPLIFPEEDKVLSGGNFHGEPLALAFDQLSIAMAELGSISERRSYFLLSGQRGLPAFLTSNPGLNSGLMIPQYTAASLVSRNKQLATPASVDTIDSSNRQEDHVSMGANAAVQCLKVVQNLEQILAIELLTASQALSFRNAEGFSPVIREVVNLYREEVPVIEEDRELYIDIRKSASFMMKHKYLPAQITL